MHAGRAHPQQALAVYAESFAAGARVAVFGDASLGLGERLLGLGARGVHLWDPDARRATAWVRETQPAGLVVEAYDAYAPPTGWFDLAIVPELGRFDDPADLMARLRVLVGDEGVVVVAASTGAGGAAAPGARTFDYYELFDQVAVEFESVRMVAELPFRGVALVALGEVDDAPPVSVDTQLAEADRSPVGFVAVASQSEMGLEPYAIIELGPAAGDDAAHPWSTLPVAVPDTNHLEAGDTSERVEHAEIRARNEAERARELESALAARERRVAELSAELEALRAAAETERVAAVEIEATAHRANRAEGLAARLEHELAGLAESHGAELSRLEGALRERAQEVRSLEVEIQRRERIALDLIGALEEDGRGPVALPPSAAEPPTAQAPEPDSVPPFSEGQETLRLREQLDALALEVARREGEAQAMAWTVAELERRLALAEQNESGVASGAAIEPIGPSELAADGEVDVLRQALVQEYEARRLAESGEALAVAQAEVARLTVLLEQKSQAEPLETGEPADPERRVRGVAADDVRGMP
ncbi:MAG: hypothetical protein FWD17_00925 [Polyangiaceae bacterium]|nr:hypothetical protein [Polyangiaceae bacterium]